MIRRIVLFTFATLITLAATSSAKAQTTQLTQTAPGPNCHTYGCINTPLSDGELLTWCHVTTGSGCTKLSFRGLNYFMTAHTGGFPLEAVDLISTAYENNGFAVHTDFLCGRFGCGWHDGYLQLKNEYIGSDPYLYGWNGSVNVTSGTGQVGLATASPGQLTVNLESSDINLLQVPALVTILAGSLDADFTITATAPPGTSVTPVTVRATYPDGTVATMTVTVGSVPGQPSPDSKLLPFYSCGSKQAPCPGTLAALAKSGPGYCWWDGKGADWRNIHCAGEAVAYVGVQ